MIRSASAELAAWDGKIDRKTRYLAPEEAAPHPVADEPIPGPDRLIRRQFQPATGVRIVTNSSAAVG